MKVPSISHAHLLQAERVHSLSGPPSLGRELGHWEQRWGAAEGPKNMEGSRLLKGVDFKGGLSGSKFLWRDLESMAEMVTEKQSEIQEQGELRTFFQTGPEWL